MKKVYVFLLLILSTINYGQNKDLASLSNGSLINFSPLYNENEQLFGYIVLFGKGKISDVEQKFEFVFLDKNLNKVANKDFEAEISVYNYKFGVNNKNQIILYPDYKDFFSSKKERDRTIIAKERLIDLKSNTVTILNNYCYTDKQIVVCNETTTVGEKKQAAKDLSKDLGYAYYSRVEQLEDDSFLVHETSSKNKGFYFENKYTLFSPEKKVMWTYELPKDIKKDDRVYIETIYFDKEYWNFIETNIHKDKATFKFVRINLKTGQKLIEEYLPESKNRSYYSLFRFGGQKGGIYNKKDFDDKLIIMGILIDSEEKQNRIGFYKVEVDKIKNKISIVDMPFTDAKSFLPKINEKGVVENGYKLQIRDLFILKNGEVGLLFEKFKYSYIPMAGSIPKATDLICFLADEKFKLKEVKTFEKDKSLADIGDYLYSYNINDDSGVVFYYKDKQKNEEGDKNWNLYISVYKNGKFSQEKIPISSKENTIFPYIAKEGYILLREYNKNSKYNGIRLERLNF
ncbi:hypothetical protein [Flavobacterium sedimenticola]|uniref:WG repeat-containing protein n=1 Tax=Flavobacterium sedimenticola TaxID=3043286 RepID=A0ABT6XRL4_9FLAO|nr:hypothetical protein [Flavobacterium sedimenticola]MDI9257740.1 hypothetical protein [Flavobacterium sedimenticola]